MAKKILPHKKIVLSGLALLFCGTMSLALGGLLRQIADQPARAMQPDPLPSAPAPSLPPTTGTNRLWKERWRVPMPVSRTYSLAQNGKTLAGVDAQGHITALNLSTGKNLWETPILPRVNRLLATNMGDVAAWSHLNPQHPELHFLNATKGSGDAVTVPTQGAIWAVADTPTGEHVFVGTGKKEIRRVTNTTQKKLQAAAPGIAPPPDAHGKKAAWRTTSVWTTDGIPQSIVPTSTRLLVSTWLPSGLSAWEWNGMPQWGMPYPRHDSQQHFLSQDGKTLVLLSQKRTYPYPAEIRVMESETRKLLWAMGLSGEKITVLVSGTGEMIAVSSEKKQPDSSIERKLQILDREGKPLFPEKGGRFLSPQLVSLSADGTRLTVYDTTRHGLFTLNEKGKMIGFFPLLETPVQQLLSPPSCKQLVVVYTDNTVGFYDSV
jgi:outer membrane protein assembly factor BamB